MMHTCALHPMLSRNKVTILFILVSVVETLFIFYLLQNYEGPEYSVLPNETCTGNESCFCKRLEDRVISLNADLVNQIKTEIKTQLDTVNRSTSFGLHRQMSLSFHQSGPPIHLLETSFDKHHLTAREACTIEAAARHHPMSQVTLHTVNDYFNWDDPYIKVLTDSLHNFWISPLNLTKLFDGTPLAEWHRMDVIKTSSFPIEHLSDACRIVILWKHGGIYLDTDSVAVNTMHYVRNTVGLENFKTVGSSTLIFDKGHPFLAKCMTKFVEGYKGKEWGINGPMLITRVLSLMCNSSDLFVGVIGQPQLCQGVTLLPTKAFLSWWWTDLFLPKKAAQMDFSDMYTVHLWSRLSKRTLALVGKGTLIEHLFQLSCPAVYQQILRSVSGLF